MWQTERIMMRGNNNKQKNNHLVHAPALTRSMRNQATVSLARSTYGYCHRDEQLWSFNLGQKSKNNIYTYNIRKKLSNYVPPFEKQHNVPRAFLGRHFSKDSLFWDCKRVIDDTLRTNKSDTFASGGTNDTRTRCSSNASPSLNLGKGVTERYWIPTSCGTLHTLVRTKEGHVFGFGDDVSYGAVGNGLNQYERVPVRIGVNNPTKFSLYETKIISIAAGRQHSMALGTQGEIYTWGNNDKGQLGQVCNISTPFLQDPILHSLQQEMVQLGDSVSTRMTTWIDSYGLLITNDLLKTEVKMANYKVNTKQRAIKTWFRHSTYFVQHTPLFCFVGNVSMSRNLRSYGTWSYVHVVHIPLDPIQHTDAT